MIAIAPASQTLLPILLDAITQSQVVNPPAALVNAPPGTVLQGDVVSRDPSGNVLVRTQLGLIGFNSPLSLPEGATVALQVQGGAQPSVIPTIIDRGGQGAALAGGQAQAATLPPFAAGATVTLTVAQQPNGNPPLTGLNQPATGSAVAVQGAPQLAQNPGDAPGGQNFSQSFGQSSGQPNTAPVTPSVTLPPAGAIPTAAAVAVATAPSALQTLVAGERIAVEVLGINSLPAAAVAGAARPAPAAPNLLPGAGPAGAVAPAAPTELPQAVTGLGASVETGLRGATLPNAATTPGAQQFTASVVANTSTGQPVLLVGDTLLTAETSSLPVGSTVILSITSRAAAPALASAQDPITSIQLPSLAAVQDAADSLGPVGQRQLAALIPKAGPALAAEMMTLASALRSNDLSALVGAAATGGLERIGKGSALQKLADEMKEGVRKVDASGGEWRQQTMPISDGRIVQPVRLLLQEPREMEGDGDGKGRGGGKVKRFLIDLDLTSLGRIQIDGLAQPPRFDLVVRTPAILNSDIKMGLQAVFTTAVAARGLSGGLTFQVAPPLDPVGTAAKPARRPGIVV